jgi:hypothetical protein
LDVTRHALDQKTVGSDFEPCVVVF